MSATRLLAALLACAALIGCSSSEGGVTGTGLSAINGNVVQVSDDVTGEPVAPLPFPVRVAIAEFPAIAATTDGDGVFALSGSFSGALTLRFTDARTGAELGPLSLEVPAGSQTVLENIEIHTAAPLPERIQPRAVLQFDLFGRVDLVECRADDTGTLLVDDGGRPPRQFMVALTADTEIVSLDGAPLGCPDVRDGARVRVAGLLRRADQTIVASSVTLTTRRPPPPNPAPRPERLRGVVDAVACARGLIEVEQAAADEPVRRIIRLTDATEFRCADEVPAPCDCSAITVDAAIGVAGTVLPSRPGVVNAEVVVIGTGFVPVDVTGAITALTCDAGLAIHDAVLGESLRVTLTPATVIRCRDGARCVCADLRLREKVRVEGRRPTAERAVTADRVSVSSAARAGTRGAE